MEYSSNIEESYISEGNPEMVIRKLWPEVASALRLRAFPHLVGRALVIGGEIRKIEADVVFMKGLKKEVIPEEGGWVGFIIPIEIRGNPERLLEKLRELLLR
ncbi:hypothetical protein [Thermococcus sp.]